jgi:hypothetical protein
MRERSLDILLWHIARMGGWLHILTIILALAKLTGVLSLHWMLIFAPSLVYGTLMVLIFIMGHALDVLCRWINETDVPRDPDELPSLSNVPHEQKAA